MPQLHDIGFLGTGIMGLPMATNLVAAGFAVTAYDPDRARLGLLAERGVKPAASPAEAATGRDAVVVMVASGPVSDDVLFGSGGAAKAMRPGSLLIVMSSISVPEAE
ncbi:MAG: NAD(P)-binding domain-containing protein, partial [Ancalomicrobiaceae bacterium]|nr:NAD(P)-binding domain-containing protein [Ancalomicrobiaceae bacterium]